MENQILDNCINLDAVGRCCAYRSFPCVSNGAVCGFYGVMK